jgi:hypothetical protein
LGFGISGVNAREQLARRCETIEQAYEFMLAYAAQGLSGDARSLFHSVGAPGDHVLAMKTTFWISAR